VVRTDEHLTESWSKNWLTTACEKGYTLIYDEFTRSRAEANTVLLSVLEERVLVSPGIKDEFHILAVHPEFRAIFTSNPTEYVGVHKSPDALRDRMVTILLQPPDPETEIAIVRAHSHLPEEDCRRIVRTVNAIRARGKGASPPSLRTAVYLARTLVQARLPADFSHPDVIRFCQDLFAPPAVASPTALGEILQGLPPRSAPGKEIPRGNQTPQT
jgi:gas vesicle protein GvpN